MSKNTQSRGALNLRDFSSVYQESVRRVLTHWTTEMQRTLAQHCHGWAPGLFDFEIYLRASSIRFYRAYRMIAAHGLSQSICDVGGFWGVFPVTLRALGFADVTMTETLNYYGGSFDALFDAISREGVQVADYDPFAPGASLSGNNFDVVTVMAVLEHYPHSLKTFMSNVTSLLKAAGRLYLEVPNIAYWPKRRNLLLGRTPLAPLADVFRSEVPFIGHHREFTIAELRELARLGGLTIIAEDFYNYTPGSLPGLSLLLRSPIQFLTYFLVHESRECLSILCQESASRSTLKANDGPKSRAAAREKP